MLECLESRTQFAAGPTVSVSDVMLPERNTGTTYASFVVKLSAASSSPVTVDFKTVNGSAKSTSDYVSKTGRLVFEAGATSKSVQIGLLGDTTYEQTERFQLALTNPQGAPLSDATAWGYLSNDDADTRPVLSGWPSEPRVYNVTSTMDGTQQPVTWYAPPTDEPVPLLVGLHAWGFTNKTPGKNFANAAIAKGWALIYPNFRGPNRNPTAGGSPLAVQDVVDAVHWAISQGNIDTSRIYLAGGSGGGHMALQVAGRAPGLWAAVSAWVPQTNLRDWYYSTKADGLNFWRDIEGVTGGPPGASAAVDAQYAARSPVTHLSAATGTPIDINTGIKDGHVGSTPVGHSLRAFNKVAASASRFSEADIRAMEAQPSMPSYLLQDVYDPTYPARLLHRRTSGNARLTVFQGDHNFLTDAAFRWLELQRKGKPVNWKPWLAPVVQAAATVNESSSATLRFNITLPQASSTAVTINYSTANGSAKEGFDFKKTASTITFAPGQLTKTISVPVVNDSVSEGAETVFLNVALASDPTFVVGRASGTISNDDARTATAAVARAVGTNASKAFTLTETQMVTRRSAVAISDVTNGKPVVLGTCVQAKSGLLVFAAATADRQVTVRIQGDKTREPDELFQVQFFTIGDLQLVLGVATVAEFH